MNRGLRELSSGSRSCADRTAALEVRNLVVKYRSADASPGRRKAVTAVSDVSLSVATGEIVGIVGESGSGKSSLALAAVGLIPAASGAIYVGGVRRMRRSQFQLRSQVQMVFQDPYSALDPRQTVQAGLDELRSLRQNRRNSSVLSTRDALSQVGLSEEFADAVPHQLSGGQCQRVAIARALIAQPLAVIADEPTSALDVSVQAQILNLFLRLNRQGGLAILLISHDLGVIHQVCDRVFVMKEGEVVESGNTTTVIRSPSHPYTRMLIASVPGTRARTARTLGRQKKSCEVATSSEFLKGDG